MSVHLIILFDYTGNRRNCESLSSCVVGDACGDGHGSRWARLWLVRTVMERGLYSVVLWELRYGKRVLCSSRNYATFIPNLSWLFKTRITTHNEFSRQRNRETWLDGRSVRLFRLSARSQKGSPQCRLSVFSDMNIMRAEQTIRWITLHWIPGGEASPSDNACLCVCAYMGAPEELLACFMKRGGKFILQDTLLLPENPSCKWHHSYVCAKFWAGNNTDLLNIEFLNLNHRLLGVMLLRW
jgi:hypothetical protein